VPLMPGVGREGRRPHPTPGAPARSFRGRVLVVDDNEVNLRVAQALVERTGCDVDVARDGLQAVHAVEADAYALVLMDCHMPVLDGFDATRRIRALPGALARLPVVALTASALPEELAECRLAGMDDCLTKPLALAQLQRVLAAYLPASTPPSA